MFRLTKYQHCEPRIIIFVVLSFFCLSAGDWIHTITPVYLGVFLKAVVVLSFGVAFCIGCYLPKWFEIDKLTQKINKKEDVVRSLLARARVWIDIHELENAERDLCDVMVLTEPVEESVYTNIGKLLMQSSPTFSSFAVLDIWRHANWNAEMTDEEIVQAFRQSAVVLVQKRKDFVSLCELEGSRKSMTNEVQDLESPS